MPSPLKNSKARFNIPVIFYDQIGIGECSHPKNVPREFWTLGLFTDELENVLQHLGVSTNFDLAGHSWGGMLAAQYISHKHPAGLRHLVLASTAPFMSLWVERTRQPMQKLSTELRETLEKHESEGTTNDPEHQEGLNIFNAKHACQLTPWPEEMVLLCKLTPLST